MRLSETYDSLAGSHDSPSISDRIGAGETPQEYSGGALDFLPIPLSRHKIQAWFAACAALIFLAALMTAAASQWAFAPYAQVSPGSAAASVFTFFSLEQEANLPTWFCGMGLLLCAVLLCLTAAGARAAGDKRAGSWGLLAGIFAFLSLDEVAALHERAIVVLHALPNNAHMAGSLAALLVATVVVLRFWPFVNSLPASIRNQFLIAGTVFLAGAVGIDLLEAKVGDYLHHERLHLLISPFEKMFQMVAITVFLGALMQYMAERTPRFSMRWAASSNDESSAKELIANNEPAQSE